MRSSSLKGHWTHFVLFGLGIWLVATALSFAHKSSFIVTSDIVAGVLVAFFAIWGCVRGTFWTRWMLVLVGLWLQLAPLVAWAPFALSYVNDTLVGVAIIGVALLLSPDPFEEAIKGLDTPHGWSYNPSNWLQRLPVIFFSLLAWMFARYMAAYQLGYIDTIWDPFFAGGTEKVITSKISHEFPVPDAGLGALAYTVETLMGIHGSKRRWHTLPWFVALFGLLVIPVGLTSIVLITLQPIIVGAWCSWCLLTALCMLLMIAFSIDEVVATLHFLYLKEKEGARFERVFWKGADAPDAYLETRGDASEAKAFFFGVSFAPTLLLSALLGLWILFAPGVLGEVKGTVSDLSHIFGALIVTTSLVACAEVVRVFRFFNVVLGLATMVLALFATGYVALSALVAGLFVILLSFSKGKIYEQYGPWSRHIF